MVSAIFPVATNTLDLLTTKNYNSVWINHLNTFVCVSLIKHRQVRNQRNYFQLVIGFHWKPCVVILRFVITSIRVMDRNWKQLDARRFIMRPNHVSFNQSESRQFI
jgi:hypothetical protein